MTLKTKTYVTFLCSGCEDELGPAPYKEGVVVKGHVLSNTEGGGLIGTGSEADMAISKSTPTAWCFDCFAKACYPRTYAEANKRLADYKDESYRYGASLHESRDPHELRDPHESRDPHEPRERRS